MWFTVLFAPSITFLSSFLHGQWATMHRAVFARSFWRCLIKARSPLLPAIKRAAAVHILIILCFLCYEIITNFKQFFSPFLSDTRKACLC
jgi:hypothetical protein